MGGGEINKRIIIGPYATATLGAFYLLSFRGQRVLKATEQYLHFILFNQKHNAVVLCGCKEWMKEQQAK